MGSTYSIHFARRAEGDIDSIARAIEKASVANAGRFVTHLFDSIATLAMIPHRNIVNGFPGDGLHPLRSLPVLPYVVFFRVFDNAKTVHVLRVIHGARKRPSGLR